MEPGSDAGLFLLASTCRAVAMINASAEAWNGFVGHSDPERYDTGSTHWAAAVACRFMGQINSGGMNSFLTYSWEQNPADVAQSLHAIGAHLAADQLMTVVNGLGRSLWPNTEEERWMILENCWKDEFDAFESFSDEAETELMAALEAHVNADEAFYLSLREHPA